MLSHLSLLKMQNSEIQILGPHFQRFSFPVDSYIQTDLQASKPFIEDAFQVVLKGLGFLRGFYNHGSYIL